MAACCAACSPAVAAAARDASYPFDLGTYSRIVTHTTEEGFVWFTRGMIWLFSFHHEEAAACFTKAVEADPGLPMAHWGIAYAHGPNYNFSAFEGYYQESNKPSGFPSQKVAAEEAETAASALQALEAEGVTATVVERALIRALQLRMTWPAQPDAAKLLTTFSDEMRILYGEHAGDADVAMVFAESLMNLKPWRLWNKVTGEAEPEAVESRAVLEAALDMHPDHPGLLHLYIHLMEMSPEPEAAHVRASHLRSLVPDSGHLCHMPTHIDVQLGNYSAAVKSNADAVRADKLAFEHHSGTNIYIGYSCHNYHMLVYAAMLAAQEAVAMEFAAELQQLITVDRMSNPYVANGLEAYYATTWHVMIRFGRWEEILSRPTCPDNKTFCTDFATALFAKGLASAALGRIPDALKRESQLNAVMATKEISQRRLHNCTVIEMMAVNQAMLRGEILYRQGNYDEAWKFLRSAIELEDHLPYDEPWGKMQPVRHALGGLMLEQGYVAEAQAVFEDDMARGRPNSHPNNPWSLRGLLSCQEAAGEAPEVIEDTKARLHRALADADFQVTRACACCGMHSGES